MTKRKHFALTVLTLLLLGGVSSLLVHLRKQPELVTPDPVIPAVRVVKVAVADIPVTIRANGTVRARTTTQLTPQVSGQIVEVSAAFEEGGFFREGDRLLRIDPIRYETQVATAESQLATARLALEREEALAKRNRRDWKRLGKGEPQGLAANAPQLAKAQADVKAAEATLKAARHDLSQTEILAPYTGRIRAKMADVGQSVSALGSVLADIYAIDYAEVVVPLPSEDAWFLDLPALGESRSPDSRLKVTISGKVGGKEAAVWEGYVDRSTGLIDPQNRFVNVIVRVEDPYGFENERSAPPLQIGQFVEVTVPGRMLERAIELPREALLPDDRVLVIKDQVIAIREVNVARRESVRVLITEGLADGDMVSVTRLNFYAEGMRVQPVTQEPAKGALIQRVQGL